MSELRRHIMMQQGGGGSILPPEYQQVEWIKSVINTNTYFTDQYIDTGVIFTNDTTIGLVFSLEDCLIQSATYFWGQGANAYGGRYSIVNANFISIAYNHSWSLGGSVTIDKNSVHTVEFTKDTFTCDGVNYGSFWNGNSYGSIFLFRSHRSNITYGVAGMKIMHSYSYVNGDKTSDLYPCYRKSDNVVGMYDIVNDIFLTNQGTGNFIAGPDVR